MSEKKAPGEEPVYVHDEPEVSPEPEMAPPGQAEFDTPQGEANDADIQALSEALEKAEAEAGQFRDQYVRARAELDNVRKRAERDVDAARKFAIEKFAADLLGVRDSLDMGLQAAEEHSGDFDKLLEGMEMTRKMLVQSMERFGVEIIEAEGETFNPEFHEAMTMQPSADHPPNTVVSVLQKGFTLNGRVLRPAMVVVSKAAD